LPIGTNLTRDLWALPWNTLATYNATNRSLLRTAVQALFSTVGADTRRPVNEISLEDWGLLVGSLYKAAIAAVTLGQQPSISNLRWQLLSIRTDGVTYLSTVTRLPDLIARQDVLKSALNKVQTLLEETYPLASKVYRDENGALFVVPDLPGIHLLDDLQDSNKQTLRGHIQQQFATNGDVVAEICLDATAWWGQDPNHATRTPPQNEIPPAGRILAQQPMLQSDRERVAASWQNQSAEICPICGLRPCANNQINTCTACGERRKGRVGKWMQAQNSTIWLDEVADGNGRLALLTGTFDLSDWLNGKLVETLLVRSPSPNPVTKTPSFARLRRIWRTTQQFWQETQTQINTTLADSRRRLQIKLLDATGLTEYQVYELDLLGHTRMSILWDGSHLISTDNLSYTARQLNIPTSKCQTPADAALEVGTWFEQNKARSFKLVSDDEKNKQFDIQIADIDYQEAAYSTTIPILAEPRTFMALVPADKALDIINAIKTKYEREMGKVRNRLPLHLGAVYFHRRTPLAAALDAGRRMLKRPSPTVKAEVTTMTLNNPAPDGWPQSVTVTLQIGGRQIAPTTPTVMGDGVTHDVWYPYWQVAGKPSDRTRWFAGADGEHWVHLCDLRAGDSVSLTPSTFDFEFLDTTARRFEVAYAADGQRRGRDKQQRPYLLEEIPLLEQAWQEISRLSTSQIKALEATLEGKRRHWQEPTGTSAVSQTFRQFSTDLLRKAGVYSDTLAQIACTGLLADALELYLTINKIDDKTDPQKEAK
jgi:hypothetical protein